MSLKNFSLVILSLCLMVSFTSCQKQSNIENNSEQKIESPKQEKESSEENEDDDLNVIISPSGTITVM